MREPCCPEGEGEGGDLGAAIYFSDSLHNAHLPSQTVGLPRTGSVSSTEPDMWKELHKLFLNK